MDITTVKLQIITFLSAYRWQLAGIVIVIFILALLFKHRYYYQKKQFLCSKSEIRLFKYLTQILPRDYYIHCQTSLISLLKPADFRSARMIWAKRVDYVITDRDCEILLVIELDDRSHERKDRKKRDKFVNKILKDKHPLLRITTEQAKNQAFVRRQIERHLD